MQGQGLYNEGGYGYAGYSCGSWCRDKAYVYIIRVRVEVRVRVRVMVGVRVSVADLDWAPHATPV